jgi:hypothetical protein
MANSHVKLEQWVKYAKCMVMGFSIRKSARICDVSLKTSFYMRHRLLDAVHNFQGIDWTPSEYRKRQKQLPINSIVAFLIFAFDNTY